MTSPTPFSPRLLLLLGAAGLLAACDAPPPPAGPSGMSQPPSAERQPAAAQGNLRQRQADFLNRIRSADPDKHTIDRAMLNEQNELGLILDRSVEMDKIPALMRQMLTVMAKEFPGQDLTILAYTPSEPPHKIGTARLDARTRDLSYTPER